MCSGLRSWSINIFKDQNFLNFVSFHKFCYLWFKKILTISLKQLNTIIFLSRRFKNLSSSKLDIIQQHAQKKLQQHINKFYFSSAVIYTIWTSIAFVITESSILNTSSCENAVSQNRNRICVSQIKVEQTTYNIYYNTL